jgi:hypothetical protein
VLLEWLKYTSAHTMMAVTAAALPITAGLAKNAACGSPAPVRPGLRGGLGDLLREGRRQAGAHEGSSGC